MMSCFLVDALDGYEACHLGYFRRWAEEECLHQIKADDSFTHCISIGPVRIIL